MAKQNITYEEWMTELNNLIKPPPQMVSLRRLADQLGCDRAALLGYARRKKIMPVKRVIEGSNGQKVWALEPQQAKDLVILRQKEGY